MDKHNKIYVAGHMGLVGSAVVRKLKEQGYLNIIARPRIDLDLCNQAQVKSFFSEEKPDHVFMCAGDVGGIIYNKTKRTQIIYENALMALNVIHASKEVQVRSFLYLGSSCQYPHEAQKPLKPESLLTGPFTQSNEGYALAKSLGLKLCDYIAEDWGMNFMTAIPCNMYGSRDNFHCLDSHFIAAIMRKCHTAKVLKEKTVVVLGTGQARREILHADDVARALIRIMNDYIGTDPVNIGSGVSFSVCEIAHLIRNTVGGPEIVAFDGNTSYDGVLDKTMDVSVIKSLGWLPEIPLFQGLEQTYQWSLDNKVLDL